MYIIIKHVKIRESMKLPVIMLDSQCEVLEYDNKDKAQEMVNILNTNSDSGHKYELKKV
jgi:gluconate kinase